MEDLLKVFLEQSVSFFSKGIHVSFPGQTLKNLLWQSLEKTKREVLGKYFWFFLKGPGRNFESNSLKNAGKNSGDNLWGKPVGNPEEIS